MQRMLRSLQDEDGLPGAGQQRAARRSGSANPSRQSSASREVLRDDMGAPIQACDATLLH
jgi:hypothetical protein